MFVTAEKKSAYPLLTCRLRNRLRGCGVQVQCLVSEEIMSSGRTEYPDPEVIAACCPNKENLLHEKYIFLFHNSLQSIKSMYLHTYLLLLSVL